MTTIDHLGILGIRSYGAEEETFVKFFHPLTIILGRNGSGKSTIIEAIKMATTGDLPPMIDRGGAFIHDPRIDNEIETRAKIRLKFTTVKGEQYIVSRHFHLTIRPGLRGGPVRPEFKSDDQTLKRLRDDRSDSLAPGTTSTFRKGDLDSLLPEVLRITKPVLDNVIFVHQEDSLWPLADSKTLKDKFDEIFAATRYSKALDTIRKYRRDQAAELRTVNADLARYADKVAILEKIRSEVAEIKEKHDGLQKGQNELTGNLTSLKSQLDEARMSATAFTEKKGELKKLQIEGELIQKEKREKYSAMQLHLRDHSEEDLHKELQDQQRSLERAGTARAKRAQIIEQLTSDVDMRRVEFNTRQSRRGMMEEQAKKQEERLERLEAMKKEFEEKRIFSNPLVNDGKPIPEPQSSDDLDTWTSSLESVRRDAEANVQKVTDESNIALDKANAALSEVKLKQESARIEENRKTEELVAKRAELTAIRNELRSLQVSQSPITDAESKLSAIEKTLQQKNSNNSIKSLEDGIVSDRRSISLLREDLSSARRNRDQLLQDQSEQARLQVSRETAESRKKYMHSLFEDFGEQLVSCIDLLKTKDKEGSDLSALKDEIRRVSGDEIVSVDEKRTQLMDASTRVLAKRDALLQATQRAVADSQTKVNSLSIQRGELKKDVDKAKRELSRIDTSLQRLKRDLGSSDAKLKEASVSAQSNERIPKVSIDSIVQLFNRVSVSDERRGRLQDAHIVAVSNCVKEVDEAIVSVSHSISELETGIFIAESDLAEFEKHPRHRCPACGMSSSKKVGEMRKNLSDRIERYKDPMNLTAAEKSKDAFSSAVSVVRDLQLQCNQATISIEAFTSAADRLEEVEKEEQQAKRAFEKNSKAFTGLQRNIGDGSIVEQVVHKRLELKQSITDYEKAARELSQLQASLSSGNSETVSLTEAEENVRGIEEKMQTLQDKVERDGRSLDREKEDLRRLENKWHSAQKLVLETQAMSEKHKRLQKEKEECTRWITEAEAAIESLKMNTGSLLADLEVVESEFLAVRAENSYRIKEANSELSKRAMMVQAWKDIAREVKSYKRSGKQKDLETLLQSLESIEAEIQSKSADLRGHEKDQQTAADLQKETESRIRNLVDNQRYRIQEQAEKVNERSVRHIEEEINEIEQKAGENPVEKVDSLRDEISKVNSNLHATRAERHVYRTQYEKKRKELSEAEREGSRKKYDEYRIRKQTMELASGDLDRYHRALDQALMAFHTLKMSTINQTIKELWQRTYQGTDIDEIEITSDHDIRNEGAGVAKRSFNYRVLMKRGQATLDMRGRCSSGQKVLACLVIRLALAESFCSECGILALDEPTTNLDRPNIASLAQALRAIIEAKQRQRTFQLILITHDEEFIEMIGARDFASEYFKIYRDERQKSRAKIEPLVEVGA